MRLFLSGLLSLFAFVPSAAAADRSSGPVRPKAVACSCGEAAVPPSSFPDVICLGVCGPDDARVACRYATMKGLFYESAVSAIEEFSVSVVGEVEIPEFARHLGAHTGWKVDVDPELEPESLERGVWTGALDDARLPLERLGEAHVVFDREHSTIRLRSTLFDEDRMPAWLAEAGKGNARAQYIVGLAYATGRTLPQNDAEAVKWIRAAAKAEDPDAQDLLGTMHYSGRGVSQSDKKAARWYREAAEQGHAGATSHLCAMVVEGKTTSAYPFTKSGCTLAAAAGGSAGAQYAWGLRQIRMSENPLHPDPEKYLVDAYVWLDRAAVQGHAEAAARRDRLFQGMTEEQRIRAVRRLAEPLEP